MNADLISSSSTDISMCVSFQGNRYVLFEEYTKRTKELIDARIEILELMKALRRKSSPCKMVVMKGGKYHE